MEVHVPEMDVLRRIANSPSDDQKARSLTPQTLLVEAAEKLIGRNGNYNVSIKEIVKDVGLAVQECGCAWPVQSRLPQAKPGAAELEPSDTGTDRQQPTAPLLYSANKLNIPVKFLSSVAGLWIVAVLQLIVERTTARV